MKRTPVACHRRGITLVETCLCLVMGVMIITLSFSVVSLAHRSENMGGLRSDATLQAALAHASLDADLGALADDAAQDPVEVADGPGGPWGRLTFHRWDPVDPARKLPIEYVFDAGSGTLFRRAPGQEERRYFLGKGSLVRFAIRHPVTEEGKAPVRGAYHNTVTYRISARAANARGQRCLTLVGTVPLLRKSSWDTFLFWNLPTYATRPGEGREPIAVD